MDALGAGAVTQHETVIRRYKIATAYLNGEKLEAIAAQFGVTRQRVEQIARETGMPHRRPRRCRAAAKLGLDRKAGA